MSTDEMHNKLGVHLLFNLIGSDSDISTDAKQVEAIGKQIVEDAGLTLLSSQSHQFQPQGATALFLLAESHLSIHTWPEKNLVACDVFCCTDKQTLEEAKTKAEKVAKLLAEAFKAEKTKSQVIFR